MAQLNCWEMENCRRAPGGAKVQQLGVCAASIETRANGANGGKNAGRACRAIAGTLCGGTVQGTFATKLANCLQCEFYQQVGREEGSTLQGPREVLPMLQ